MRRRQRRLGLWALAVCVAVLVLWWTHQPAVPTGISAVRGLTGQAHTSQLPLRITPTNLKWNGKPVYRLENLSAQAMSHLQVFSWSNQPLPILWTGRQRPVHFPTNGPVVGPPVTLASGQSAWFELADTTLRPLTVLWRQHLSAVYETLAMGQ